MHEALSLNPSTEKEKERGGAGGERQGDVLAEYRAVDTNSLDWLCHLLLCDLDRVNNFLNRELGIITQNCH
jgi:hypothetical protein